MISLHADALIVADAQQPKRQTESHHAKNNREQTLNPRIVP